MRGARGVARGVLRNAALDIVLIICGHTWYYGRATKEECIMDTTTRLAKTPRHLLGTFGQAIKSTFFEDADVRTASERTSDGIALRKLVSRSSHA